MCGGLPALNDILGHQSAAEYSCLHTDPMPLLRFEWL